MEKRIVSQIINECPNAFKALVDYMLTQCDVGQQPAKEVLSMEKMQELLMMSTPAWHLYQFFDDNRILMFIVPDSPGHWKYQMLEMLDVGDGPQSGEMSYKYRLQAQEAGFLEAFRLLEFRL